MVRVAAANIASDIDPLSIAWAPPPDESVEARNERLQQEAAAQKISDAIDESLRAEKAALNKKKKPVKILLLGQAESGAFTSLSSILSLHLLLLSLLVCLSFLSCSDRR